MLELVFSIGCSGLIRHSCTKAISGNQQLAGKLLYKKLHWVFLPALSLCLWELYKNRLKGKFTTRRDGTVGKYFPELTRSILNFETGLISKNNDIKRILLVNLVFQNMFSCYSMQVTLELIEHILCNGSSLYQSQLWHSACLFFK